MGSRARRDIRRNLLLILLALVALGGMIAFVGIVQGGVVPVLMPEERAKFLEHRADVTGNGFSDLLDACKALEGLGPVPQCEDLLRTGKLSLRRPMNPQNPLETSDALGRYMGANSFCPNDDPRFKEYMDKTDAVLPAVQTALAKPFIFRSSVSIVGDSRQPDPLAPVNNLVRRLCAFARYDSIITGDTAKAVAMLQSAIAIGRKLEESGSFDLHVGNSNHPAGREGFFRFGLSLSDESPWTTAPVLAKYAVDRNESLDALLDMTRPVLDEPSDRSQLLFAYCMMLDDLLEGTQVPSDLDMGHRLIMAMVTRTARRDARILAEQETAIRGAVNGPLGEFPAAIRKIAGEGGIFGPKFLYFEMALMNVRSVLEGRRIVAALAVRVEAFRKDHGDYPEKLDELLPQYLSKIPVHPSSGKPLDYTKYKEGYVISENGASGMSGMNRMYPREDITIDTRVIPALTPSVGSGISLPPGSIAR